MERKTDTKDDEAATQRVRLWFLFSLPIFFSFFNHSLFLGFSTMTSLLKFTLDMSPYVKFMNYLSFFVDFVCL
ncbi:hypothetical protein OIU79_005053 [Salix purpurea]|uniref:Uncharacterized protein n=1 Tax=Salix purpurea TaxID=77065 RepID=A0A9Q0UBS1_SALPP|nr:hypothetical protein OIU79_005053 [Salix purpurea]